MKKPITILIMAAFILSAAASKNSDPSWTIMVMELLGGLALFLFGMEQMADALKSIAGDRMKSILAKLTSNRIMGVLTGAFVTAIIQSSSVTTVLVVGFISAGLMSTAQSIGIIMGANVGTTITAQIIAFKITKAALLMIAIGFGMLYISKSHLIKKYGGMIMGLGLVFFGMKIMSDAMYPLRSYEPFLNLMQNMESPILGILTAAAFTGLVQSSSATTGIVIVMASQGLITLEAGIVLIFGSNVGTCVTALLAAIGKPREAIRAALAHVLFNVLGVLIWIAFIDQLALWVQSFSPSAEHLSGIDRMAAETPRQIANAHTLFNVANTFIFIGFTGVLAKVVERLVPDKPLSEQPIVKSKYLDDALLDTPALALARVRLEIGELGLCIQSMLRQIMPALIGGDPEQLKRIAEEDEKADIIHGHILTFIGKISALSLSEKQTKEVMTLMAAANDLENIGDIIETDLVSLGTRRFNQNVDVSQQTQKILNDLHESVSDMVKKAIYAVVEESAIAAKEVVGHKSHINDKVEAAHMHQAQRLIAAEPNRLAAYTLEVDIIEKLKRIYYFAKRIGKAGAQSESP